MQQNGGSSASGTQSGTGIAPNVAGALSYVLGFITGIVFLLLEKDPFVRFHAYQSILLSAAWVVLQIAFSILSSILLQIPFLGFLVVIIGLLVSLVLGLGMFVLEIMLIIKAFQGQRWKLPFIGDMAEKYAAQ
jgi:uncharacterized membrane protein